jgi:hypothetical protein
MFANDHGYVLEYGGAPTLSNDRRTPASGVAAASAQDYGSPGSSALHCLQEPRYTIRPDLRVSGLAKSIR